MVALMDFTRLGQSATTRRGGMTMNKTNYIRVRTDSKGWPHVWFRGEPGDIGTPLLPKLYRRRRDGSEHNENKLLQAFRMRAPIFAAATCPDRSAVDQWLFLARHVGSYGRRESGDTGSAGCKLHGGVSRVEFSADDGRSWQPTDSRENARLRLRRLGLDDCLWRGHHGMSATRGECVGERLRQKDGP
jgi:hypothetical protein